MPDEAEMRNFLRDAQARLDAFVAYRHVLIHAATRCQATITTHEQALPYASGEEVVRLQVTIRYERERLKSLQRSIATLSADAITAELEFDAVAAHLAVGDPDAVIPQDGAHGAIQRTLERIDRALGALTTQRSTLTGAADPRTDPSAAAQARELDVRIRQLRQTATALKMHLEHSD